MAKTKRSRQADLPEMTERKIKDIEEAADDYIEQRDARMSLTKKEVAAKGELKKVMMRHKKDRYESEDIVIEIEPPDGESTITVRRKKKKPVVKVNAEKDE